MMTTTATSTPTAIDPITLEVIRHQLVAIPNQIEKNIERTAFSPLIYEYKDYSVGFVDPQGRLVAQSSGSLPIFVANALGTGVREGLATLGTDGIHDGDVIITNSAAWLGQHLNNVVAYTPIRQGGELLGFFAVLVHWVDVGGAVPGSCLSSWTRDVWQEGIQYPTVKLIERGVRRDDVFRLIAVNSRFPKLLLGDIEAQLGGCLVGHQMVLEVFSRYGIDAVRQAIRSAWEDADRNMANALASARPGRYEAESFLDDDGVREGQPVPVKVAVEVIDGRLEVDFSGLALQVEGPFNAGRNGGAIAAARIACKYLFAPTTPVNEGDFARLDVKVPDGTFMSARHDAPIGQSGSTVPTIVDTVIRALSQAFPDKAVAAHHGIYGIHSFYGRLPDSGEIFQHLDTITGGWGAAAHRDGHGPFRSNGHGDVPDVPVELQEALYPYRIESRRLIPDSGGAGQYRGGLATEKTYRMLADCNLVVAFDRTLCPPWGLAGGRDGSVSGIEIRYADGRRETLTKGERRLVPGDRVTVRSGGGGGYGDPAERDPAAIALDLERGYVTETR